MNPGACAEHAETFWTLVTNTAHWELELFIMLVFDVLIGAIAWPFVRRHLAHHLARDIRDRASGNLREAEYPGQTTFQGLPVDAVIPGNASSKAAAASSVERTLPSSGSRNIPS